MTTQTSVPNDRNYALTTCGLMMRQLVDKCLRGEEAAWTVLLSKYKNLIFSDSHQIWLLPGGIGGYLPIGLSGPPS